MRIKPMFVTLLTIAVSLTALTGCRKSAIDEISGSYTFKTSGRVGFVPSAQPEEGPVDTTWVELIPEQGQLNIVAKDREQSRLIVTWQDILGGAFSSEATLSGNTLQLSPSAKSISLAGTILSSDRIRVRFSGTGTRYDNMLIMTLDYQGEAVIGLVPMTIAASEIECIAKAN